MISGGYDFDCKANSACEAAAREYNNKILGVCAAKPNDSEKEACVGSYYRSLPTSFDNTVQATSIAQDAFEKLQQVVAGQDANAVFGGAPAAGPAAPTGQAGAPGGGGPSAAPRTFTATPTAVSPTGTQAPHGAPRSGSPPIAKDAYTGDISSPDYPYKNAQTRRVLLVHREDGADAYVIEGYGHFDGGYCADHACGFSRCYYFSELNGNKPNVDEVFAEAIANFAGAKSRADGRTSMKLGKPEAHIKKDLKVVGFQRCDYGNTELIEAVVGE